MKLFACDHCQQILFFESVQCTRCGRPLAYLPDRGLVSAIERLDELDESAPDSNGLWRATSPSAEGARYRLCRNQREHAVCNWVVPESDPEEYCRSCRLNHMIPDLSDAKAKEAWYRLETAKRRLVYTLLDLGLPVDDKTVDPEHGLAFSFLRDDESSGEKVYTGHSDGLVTINIAEADASFREKVREEMGERYRTLLGHFRHEIGHYYWDRLVKESAWIDRFRELFGDERESYADAQKRHYNEGPAADWPSRFVSAYASMHPWEDWAETWAHYLHMTDTLETARAYGLALKPEAATGHVKAAAVAIRRLDLESFEDLVRGWFPLTLAVNSLNRSMGLADGYPFVLAEPALEKLRFVHEVIVASRAREREDAEAA